MRKKLPTQQEILADLCRVMEATKSPQWPNGDTRSSVYFAKGSYSRHAVYHVFTRGWEQVLKALNKKLETVGKATVRNKRERQAIEMVPKRQYEYKPRTCLACGKVFQSFGPENRKCPRCKTLRPHLESAGEEEYHLSLPFLGHDSMEI